MAVYSLEDKVTALLQVANQHAGFELSLVCTDQGLLIALAGDPEAAEIVAGVTSLFSDMVVRAVRDLSFNRLDEVTLLDPKRGRIVIRPVPGESSTTFFLVIRAKATVTWRKTTSELTANLVPLLSSFSEGQ